MTPDAGDWTRVGEWPRPHAAEAAQQSIVDALREMLRRAERGRFGIADDPHGGIAVVLEHENVRCVLVVKAPTVRHTLSPREQQIARLVAGGATNRMIASTLEISLWTVSTHIRRVFAKLDVRSRAEMVARLFGSSYMPAGSPVSLPEPPVTAVRPQTS
jgi:DNA-binding NarL/FixJ family response regulator